MGEKNLEDTRGGGKQTPRKIRCKWRVTVERNDIFGLNWRFYGLKQVILDFWVTLIFGILSYYIQSMDKGLQG